MAECIPFELALPRIAKALDLEDFHEHDLYDFIAKSKISVAFKTKKRTAATENRKKPRSTRNTRTISAESELAC